MRWLPPKFDQASEADLLLRRSMLRLETTGVTEDADGNALRSRPKVEGNGSAIPSEDADRSKGTSARVWRWLGEHPVGQHCGWKSGGCQWIFGQPLFFGGGIPEGVCQGTSRRRMEMADGGGWLHGEGSRTRIRLLHAKMQRRSMRL